MRYLAIGFGALLAVLFITFFALMAGRTEGGIAEAGNHCDRIPEEAKPCPTPIPTLTDTPIASPTPSPVLTPPPSVTPTATSGLESPTTPIPTATSQVSPTPILGMPLGFPNTGGGGADGGEEAFCRDWTTGQAGDSSTPCPTGGNLVGTLKTVGILLVFIGLAALAFWALFRRG